MMEENHNSKKNSSCDFVISSFLYENFPNHVGAKNAAKVE
ncbi:hypothetical protein LEP1GSC172_2318 [Leptospira noguchii]|uniref:Uncharacterized protein n=1 Tax=Leptospira noguchii TaxID=28182 RepID=M6V8H6_9LEPT|nr:hypothetical protein LEP1GSC172_2318 [Leptospira noguchii]